MAKIELRVVDPKVFNSGTNELPSQLTYGDTDSPIVIDTETAFIECEAQNKSAAIKQWVVDFDSHKMMLAGDAPDGRYREIDYVTAMGMVGQLVEEVGIPTLQTLLATLGAAYVSDNKGDTGPAQPSGSDAPTDAGSDIPAELPSDSQTPPDNV